MTGTQPCASQARSTMDKADCGMLIVLLFVFPPRPVPQYRLVSTRQSLWHATMQLAQV
jgi:hypothetical protein